MSRRRYRFQLLLGFCFLIPYCISPIRSMGQAQQPTVLVIEGGTLIDGNGGTPVQDALIVIQDNRITSVTRKGQGNYPANAQVIKADGKFILPGYWDARVNFVWFVSEPLLVNGITSIIDMAVGGEVQVVHRDAVEHGKIPGPRTFTGVGFISSRPTTVQQFLGTGFETPLMPGRVPKSVEDARQITKNLLAGKPNMIVIQDGNIPLEYYQAIADEARKGNTPVFARPAGPMVDPKAAVLAGINAITHSGDGLGVFVTKDPSKWRGDAVEAWADLDDAKASELAQLFIQRKITLEPNFVEFAAGLSEKWAHWELEDRKMFSDVSLRSYYPDDRIQSVIGIYTRPPLASEVRARMLKGLMNAVQFHQRVAQGGGRVLIGSDSPSNAAVGKGFHHEVEIMAEGGFTPMQVIQSATKWPAEAAQALNRLGTIEVGKLADIVLLTQDPLQDSRNMQKIDSVIFNGKMVERTFHSWHRTPFGGNSPNTNPVVDQLPWAVAVKQATVTGGGGQGAGPNTGRERLAPPGIETISPYIVTEGSPALALTLKGFNFFARTQVFLENIPMPYKRVSGTELQVNIDESYLRRPGRYQIRVYNSPPHTHPEWGNGMSNPAYLIVNYKY